MEFKEYDKNGSRTLQLILVINIRIAEEKK